MNVKVKLLLLIGLISGCASNSTPLFDGRSLNGWNQLGDANWAVREGAITAERGEGYLVSTERYSNYVLEVEFTVDADVNSGVFVHCQDEQEITPLNCYEINIWDDHPNQAFRTGAIVTKASPTETINTVGKWNRYRILVSGEELQVMLNGTLVSSLSPLDKSSGMIAVQHIGEGSVRFRQIVIEQH